MTVAVQSYTVGDAASLSASFTINKPTGTVSGDLLIGFVTSFGASSVPALSGFTVTQFSGINEWLVYKTAGGSEPSSYTVSRTGGTGGAFSGILFRVTGNDPGNLVDVSGGAASTSTAGITITGATAISPGLLLSVLFKNGNIAPTSTAPSGMTLGADDSSGAASAVAYATQTISAGATGNLTWGSTATPATDAAFVVIPVLPVAASGSASLTIAGSGAATAPVSGSASLTIAGSGAATAFGSASGTGYVAIAGTGLAAAAVTGSAYLSVAGTGDGGASASGTGYMAFSGSGFASAGTYVPHVDNAPGTHSWTADFTGWAQVYLWGGGGGGASGKSLTYGGDGGGGGAIVSDTIWVVNGTTYSYTIGDGGIGGVWNGIGTNGSDGAASYWGDGSSYYAVGGHGGLGATAGGGLGGQANDCVGRARVSGNNGYPAPTATVYSGGQGGDGASVGSVHGGSGAPSNGQNPGLQGMAPGGGGSGGGQNSTGGKGGPGGIYITQAFDLTLPGYFTLGVTDGWAFDGAGTYDDFIPAGDGTCWVECVGGGGGGKGGLFTTGGGHSGSGGAYAASDVAVHRGVIYRRVVGSGGVGGAYNNNASHGGPGTASYFTLTPLRVIQKQLTANVATLWTYHPTSSAAQRHGFDVGDSVTVAGVDSTFNGTFTVTAVSADRLSFSYAKTASNVSATAVTPAANQVTRTTAIVSADFGLGGVGNFTGGTPVNGGQSSNCIGAITISGGNGHVVGSSSTTAGANAGGAPLPLGDRGGWGGGSALAAGVAGDPGETPGGGGGGGRNVNNGAGGDGADGAVVVRWLLSQCEVAVVPGQPFRDVTRIRWWMSGVSHTITNVSAFKTSDGLLHSTQRVKNNPASRRRRPPNYLDPATADRFNLDTGTFNWLNGAPHVRSAILANDFDLLIVGDSVSAGWTSYDGLVTATEDFPNAFPAKARDLIVSGGLGATVGGTGVVRCTDAVATDPQWATSGSSWTNSTHYLSSSDTSSVATFTPGVTSSLGGSTQITGTAVAVVTSGGSGTVTVDGAVVGTTSTTAGAGTLVRTEFTGLSNAAHVVSISPASGTLNLFGASVYTPSGIRVHNLSQGGAKAGGGTGQSYWGDTASGAPANMTACYSQPVISKSSKNSGKPDAVLIFLGGNDSNAGTDAATIKAAYDNIGQAFDGPNTDIILMPDVWTSDRERALQDLCIARGWAMVDFFWLSRALTAIFDNNYNGDYFGHLNGSGSTWAGGMLQTALMYNPI